MKNIKTALFILILGLFIVPTIMYAQTMGERLRGKIVLQVEENGEAWYVNPDDIKRYFMGRPADAFELMRAFGLGISNADFDSYKGKAPERLAGKILIKVEDHGEAYYVNPETLEMHFMGRPADAFQLMRQLGLGITNNDLARVDSGETDDEMVRLELKKRGFSTFKSEEEMRAFLSNLDDSTVNLFGFGRGLGTLEMIAEPLAAPEMGEGDMMEKSEPSPDRVSETNVQVVGIDEPDIVKTDGENIFYSRQTWGPIPFIELEAAMIPPYWDSGETKVVGAFPPEKIRGLGKIDRKGTLLLQNDILVVFSHDGVYGYDVSDPANPSEKWTMVYEDNTRMQAARLLDGTVYLVTTTWVNHSRPCPFVPLERNGEPISVRCMDLLYPLFPVSTIDSTYTIVKFDPNTGEIQDNMSVVGAAHNSILYMSPDALYLTHYYPGDESKWMIRFFVENKSRYSSWFGEKMVALQDLDISANAKREEIRSLWSKLVSGMSNDDRLTLETNTQNWMHEFTSQHLREIESTHIVKINTADFEIASQSDIPGKLLNQFAMDEHSNHLRTAVTIGGRGSMRVEQSVNDVYVLDANLKTVGQVRDLGLDEIIYSVRFIGDKGYLVTFKQIDPFYVLDLSDPTNPQVKGELKIPGFSSYLHAISDDLVVGIGREDSKVKVSLFDVSDPTNPIEASKYLLDEYWSDVQNNHHAFLIDKKFEVFFLPAGNNGYVMSYKDNTLSLEKAVTGTNAERALYINDYLYVIGTEMINVYDEGTWEKVSELKF